MFLVVRVKAGAGDSEPVELDLSQAFLCADQTQVSKARKKLKKKKRGQKEEAKTITLVVQRTCGE